MKNKTETIQCLNCNKTVEKKHKYHKYCSECNGPVSRLRDKLKKEEKRELAKNSSKA